MPNSGDHYFTASPSSESHRRTVRLVLPDLSVDLVTDRGVFSPDAVDAGTKLLLAEAPGPPADGEIVDLGCGYGPIAVVLALRSPNARVWAVDVNERARELARLNAVAAGVGGRVSVCSPEAVPRDLEAAAVYSNPPIRVGKAALQRLLSEWLARLARPDGRAELVVHKHLGSDSLARWLAAEGYDVRRVVSRMGYRVLEVRCAT